MTNDLSSGVSAASRLLDGETRHVPYVSWELGAKAKVPKTEKFADLAHYFSGMAKFLYTKSKTSNVRGSISGLNRIFMGKYPSKFQESKSW